MICPDCGSVRREDGFNRRGWYWLGCHRRYNPSIGTYSPKNDHCRNIQLEERVRELEIKEQALKHLQSEIEPHALHLEPKVVMYRATPNLPSLADWVEDFITIMRKPSEVS